MFKKFAFVFSVILASAVALIAGAQLSPFNNIRNYVRLYHLDSYFDQTPDEPLKIAIFDTDFAGYDDAAREGTLPGDNMTIFHKPSQAILQSDVDKEHGRVMAQVVYALMTDEGRQKQFTPEMHLYYVGGFKNFSEAITDCINNGVQMILYSSVREWGGNNDGQGIFNTEVNRALAAGIIWVNAAGDYRTRTYTSPVVSHNDAVQLPDDNSLLIKCGGPDIDPATNTCKGKITLAWNDFKNVKDIGTNKDLDIRLYNSDFSKFIGSGENKQSEQIAENKSIYPKEEIPNIEVPPGDYYIRVLDKSHNFIPGDRLTIAVDGPGFLVNHYDVNSVVFTPADNPGVITVGASDSPRSSVSNFLHKPEQTTRSYLVLKDGRTYDGSSISAAIVFAGDALLKTLRPDLTRNQLLMLTSDPVQSVTFPVGEGATNYFISDGEAYSQHLLLNARYRLPYPLNLNKK